MAKRSKQRKATPARKEGSAGRRIPHWLPDAAAVAALYIVTWILFAPFLTEDARFSASGDAAGARAWNDTAAEIAEQTGDLPLWSPWVFCGFPIYGSLSYHASPNFNVVEMAVEGVRFLFGTAVVNKEAAFFFFSGLFMFLFARGIGIGVLGSLLAGLAFLLNPYNVSLMTAGHGSKHWTIAMMPLVFLLTHRALAKRRIVDLGLLALGVSASLLAMHVQIAYYTLLVAGLYALVWIVGRFLRREPGEALRGGGVFAGGSALGLGMAASIYLPVYVFQRFSIRGTQPLLEQSGPAGLDWQYATNWSLHPLETLQFLVPGLFGLGGVRSPDQALVRGAADVLDYNLYWGSMPFTMSSLYMGIIPLVLAVLAAVWLWKRNGVVRWMAIAAVLAVIVSFGRFVPVLYGPMYHGLPFFAKFRVPSMALVVTAAGVALLGGVGLHELLRRLKEGAEEVRRKTEKVLLVLGGVALLGLLASVLMGGAPSLESGLFLKEGELQGYGRETAALLQSLRWDLFLASLRITSLLLLLFAAAVLAPRWLGRGGVAVAALVGGGALVLTAADLVSLDKRFLTPVPERSYRSALAATPAMHFLRDEYRRAEEPFRVYPLGRDFQSNDWMYHRIPSIGGYAAVKLRVYQDLLDYALQKGQGMPNLKLAGAMNARYLVTAQQLPEGFQVVYRDDASQRIVYENPFYLPRAWFVDVVRVMEDEVALMERLSDPGWNPAQEALVTEAPKMKIGQPDTLSWARVPADRYGPHAFEIECSTPDDGFLVVSEIWYPQGWVATLDGEPVPIWRTNYGFRGIAVPPGEHTVRMEFHPPEVRAGFLISILSSVFVLLLVAGGAWLVVHRRAQALEARIEE